MIKKFILLNLLLMFFTLTVFSQNNDEKAIIFDTTEIKFEEKQYNFGKLAQGEIIYHDFNFTNIGNHPLIIFDARTSNECVTVNWEHDTIPAGKCGKISVKFDSSKKFGPQMKQINVAANIGSYYSILYIGGEVLLPTDTALINYDREVELKKMEESEKKYQARLDSFLFAQKMEEENTLMRRNEGWLGMYKAGINPIFLPEITMMSFAKTNFNAGIINAGEIITHSFTFTNFGNNPLYILKVETNSDRVFADYPVDGIEPGKNGEIVVKYDTLGMKGKMKLVIKVSSNTFPMESEISISAKIKAR